MELPFSSYRAARTGLTPWPDAEDQTGLKFSAEFPDPLYSTKDPDTMGKAATAPAGAEPAPRRARGSVEAARHTVLRRLAPSLKHDMVVNLQAVSMMAETLNARLERGTPDTGNLQASISKLNRLAREAVMKCVKVASWLEPGEDDTAALHETVHDCVALMAGSLNFRGFRLSSEVPQGELQVSRSAVRNLLAAALLTLADTSNGPAELVVSAEVGPGHAVLTITCTPGGEAPDAAPLPEASGPRLDWCDVQALAAAESVELFRTKTEITMRLPRALPSSPLRMAPM